VKTVLPKDEKLNPGILYVLIAGLSASVLARQRNFLVRFTLPPLFVVAAMPYFLPKTSHNLRNYLSDLEDKYLPEMAAQHDKINGQLGMHWEMLKDRFGGIGNTVEEYSAKARQGVEGATGLRLGQRLNQRPRSEAVPVETVGILVEERPIAEVVVPVESEKKLV
jgi:MICOS complex subunit MIC26